MAKFAGETSLFQSGKRKLSVIQNDMNKMTNWFARNKVSIIFQKVKIFILVMTNLQG